MNQVTLGSTGITVDQNAFGALPVQRRTLDDAVNIIRRAYEGGMRYFDTARAYTDSEDLISLFIEELESFRCVVAYTFDCFLCKFCCDLDGIAHNAEFCHILFSFHI